MKVLYFCVAALAVSAPSFTQTAVPAAPSLTAGAAFKGLQFDWDRVPGANWYQLELRAHRTGDFVQQGDDFPSTSTSTRFTLPLHLFDWTYARYRLGACNSAGCAYSSEVSVSDLRRFAVGYFKPLQTIDQMRFGDDVDLSPDGLNFVASAPGDVINANGTTYPGGSVNVFKRKAGGVWGQRAKLSPAIPPFVDGLNKMHVAISADGNTIALGMPDFASEQFDESLGEAFVYHFNVTTAKWIRTHIARLDSAIFGDSIGLNDAGDTLAVGVRGGATRIAIYKLVSGTWQNVRNMPVDDTGCGRAVLSRDGSTVAESCTVFASGATPEHYIVRVFSGANWGTVTEVPLQMSATSPTGEFGHIGLGIDRTGSTIAAQIYVPPDENNPDNPPPAPAQVNVFKKGSSGYALVTELKPGAWRDPWPGPFFGIDVSVSGDGGTIALGDTWDNGYGQGPRAAPLNPTGQPTGAFYIYRLKTTWVLANMVKPNYNYNFEEGFGIESALSNDGKTLIVGEPPESSSAQGIGGNFQNKDAPFSGGVWMY